MYCMITQKITFSNGELRYDYVLGVIVKLLFAVANNHCTADNMCHNEQKVVY